MIPIIVICSLYILAANIGISFLSPTVQHLWTVIKSLPSPQHHTRLPPSPSPVLHRCLDMAMGPPSPFGYDDSHSPTLAAPLRLDAPPTHDALAGPLVAVIGLALGIIAISNKRGAPTPDSQAMRSPDPLVCLTCRDHGIITGQGSLNASPVQLLVSPLTTPTIARSALVTAAPTLASTSPLYYPPSTPPGQRSTFWPLNGASTFSSSTPVSPTAATPSPSSTRYESGEISPRHIPPLSPPTPQDIAFIDHKPELSPTPSQATRGARKVHGKIFDRDGGSRKKVHFRDTPLFEPCEFHQPSSPSISSNDDSRDNGHNIAGLGFSDPSIFETGKRDNRSRHGNDASLPPHDVGQDKPVTRPSRSLNVLAQTDTASRPYTPASIGPSDKVDLFPTPRSRRPLPDRSLPLREDNSETSEGTEPPPRPRRRLGDFPPSTVVPRRLTQFRAPYEHIKTPSDPKSANPAQADAAGTIAVPPSPTLAEPCTSPRMDWDTQMSPESRKASLMASLKESRAELDRETFQETKDMFAHYERRAEERALKKEQRMQSAQERALKTQQRMSGRYKERGCTALEEMTFTKDNA